MYTKEQIIECQATTKEFIQNPHNIDIIELRKLLKFHEYQYYVAAAALISDYEYDEENDFEKIEYYTPSLKTTTCYATESSLLTMEEMNSFE
jgi:NAD-dependent DNA ligase